MNRNAPRLIMLLALLALTTSGCVSSKEAGIAPMTRYTLQHDGLEREYFVFLPSSYGDRRPHPLAVFMHGYGGSATGIEAEVTNGLTRYAEEYGYVMVFPQSTWFMSDGAPGERWEVTSWNHISDGFDNGPAGPICAADSATAICPPECGTCGQCGWTSCHDDVGFLKRLVAQVTSDFSIEPGGVYVSGFSNGAMMANRIACDASGLVAAAALIGGRLERGFECTPGSALPLLQINGGADDIVPHDGRASTFGYYFASTKAVVESWHDGAACATEKKAWTSPLLTGESVECTITCAGGDRESIDCLWPEGDHRWPGTPGYRGNKGSCVTRLQAASMPEQTLCIAPDPGQDAWGSRLLFEFFDRHRRE